MQQQLAQVALLPRGPPQLREPSLHQQLQNVGCVAFIDLLFPHVAGANVRWIAHHTSWPKLSASWMNYALLPHASTPISDGEGSCG
jgi:hypothetical protein